VDVVRLGGAEEPGVWLELELACAAVVGVLAEFRAGGEYGGTGSRWWGAVEW